MSHILISPYDLDELYLLVYHALLHDVVNVIDGDAKEEVHDYDGKDAYEEGQKGNTGVGKCIGNGLGVNGALTSPIHCDVPFPYHLRAVHQIIVIDFPRHH